MEVSKESWSLGAKLEVQVESLNPCLCCKDLQQEFEHQRDPLLLPNVHSPVAGGQPGQENLGQMGDSL